MSQDRELSAEPLADGRVLVTRLYYLKGNTRTRGYYVEIKPVKRTVDSTGISEMYAMFAGVREMVMPVARFNAKELASLVVAPEKLAELKAKALARIASGEDTL